MITAVPGVRVGHWTDEVARTGCTVVLLPAATTASGEVRGAAPGTREWALLEPGRSVDRVNAVVAHRGIGVRTGQLRRGGPLVRGTRHRPPHVGGTGTHRGGHGVVRPRRRRPGRGGPAPPRATQPPWRRDRAGRRSAREGSARGQGPPSPSGGGGTRLGRAGWARRW